MVEQIVALQTEQLGIIFSAACDIIIVRLECKLMLGLWRSFIKNAINCKLNVSLRMLSNKLERTCAKACQSILMDNCHATQQQQQQQGFKHKGRLTL